MSGILVSEIPLIAACVAIILVLGLSFSRLFTRKIEELTDNMNRVNQGSREVTVDSNAGDEIGLLVRSFRSMMDEINRLIHEVYENKIALKEFELKALTARSILIFCITPCLLSTGWLFEAIRGKSVRLLCPYLCSTGLL